MPHPLVLKLSRRDRLSAEEERALLDAISTPREVAADQDLVREGDRPNASTLLLEGFAARYRHLSNGKRQITSLHVSGDFVDLHSLLLKKMDHSILALTPCVIAPVSHEALRRITEHYPHLTRMLWLGTLIDSAIHRETLVSVGRRSPVAHIAHLICEIFTRLQQVERVDGMSFQFPITQIELGDVLGLSTVHANRSLQQLRAENVITWRGTTVTIENWDRLREIAEFDPTYLNLSIEPR
jgi:CRP-like cAMP-binding protein